jgi:hypothetical protein
MEVNPKTGQVDGRSQKVDKQHLRGIRKPPALSRSSGVVTWQLDPSNVDGELKDLLCPLDEKAVARKDWRAAKLGIRQYRGRHLATRSDDSDDSHASAYHYIPRTFPPS